MNSKFLYQTVFIVLIMSAGCETTEKDEFTFKGEVIGTVSGVDAIKNSGMEESEFLVGAQILFDRGDVSFSGISDDNGKFSLGEIPYGTYNITASKLGHSPQTLLGYQLYFIDSTVTFEFTLSKQSQVTKIEDVIIENDINGGVWFTFNCDGRSDDDEEFVVFFSSDPNVSYIDYEGDYYTFSWNSGYGYLYNYRIENSTHYAIYPVCSYFRWVYINNSIYSFNGFESWIEPKSKLAYEIEFNPNVEYVGRYNESN